MHLARFLRLEWCGRAARAPLNRYLVRQDEEPRIGDGATHAPLATCAAIQLNHVTAAIPGIRSFDIAVLPGDGIGVEVTAEAVRVLQALEHRLKGVRFAFHEYSVGASEYLKRGNPLP